MVIILSMMRKRQTYCYKFTLTRPISTGEDKRRFRVQYNILKNVKNKIKQGFWSDRIYIFQTNK